MLKAVIDCSNPNPIYEGRNVLAGLIMFSTNCQASCTNSSTQGEYFSLWVSRAQELSWLLVFLMMRGTLLKSRLRRLRQLLTKAITTKVDKDAQSSHRLQQPQPKNSRLGLSRHSPGLPFLLFNCMIENMSVMWIWTVEILSPVNPCGYIGAI